MKKPRVIKGDVSTDQRGRVSFINKFDFRGVKRFYQIENTQDNPIRAFHGHMREEKYAYVVSGMVLLVLVKLDNPTKPSKKTKIYRYFLSEKQPEIIYIPAGYANGFKVLTEGTKIIFFSSLSLTDAKEDDYRYPSDYWGREIWDFKLSSE